MHVQKNRKLFLRGQMRYQALLVTAAVLGLFFSGTRVAIAGPTSISKLSSSVETQSSLSSDGLVLVLNNKIRCSFQRDWAWGRFYTEGPCGLDGPVSPQSRHVSEPVEDLNLGFLPLPWNRVGRQEFESQSEVMLKVNGNADELQTLNYQGDSYLFEYKSFINPVLRGFLSEAGDENVVFEGQVATKWSPTGDEQAILNTANRIEFRLDSAEVLSGACDRLKSLENDAISSLSKGIVFRSNSPDRLNEACQGFPSKQFFCGSLFRSVLSDGRESTTEDNTNNREGARLKERVEYCSSGNGDHLRAAAIQLSARLGTKTFLGSKDVDAVAANLNILVDGLRTLRARSESTQLLEGVLRGYEGSQYLSSTDHLDSSSEIEPLYKTLRTLAQRERVSVRNSDAHYRGVLRAYFESKLPAVSAGVPGLLEIERLAELLENHRQIVGVQAAAELRRTFGGRFVDIVVDQISAAPEAMKAIAESDLAVRFKFVSAANLRNRLRSSLKSLITPESIPDKQLSLFETWAGETWVRSTRKTWATQRIEKAMASSDLTVAVQVYSRYKGDLSSSFQRRAATWIEDQQDRARYIQTILEGDRIARRNYRSGYQTQGLQSLSTEKLKTIAADAMRWVEAQRIDDQARERAEDARRARQAEIERQEYAARRRMQSACYEMEVSVLAMGVPGLQYYGSSFDDGMCKLSFEGYPGLYSGNCIENGRTGSTIRFQIYGTSYSSYSYGHSNPDRCPKIIITNFYR